MIKIDKPWRTKADTKLFDFGFIKVIGKCHLVNRPHRDTIKAVSINRTMASENMHCDDGVDAVDKFDAIES